jgi:NAD(P)H-hydrate epimerase
MKIVNVAEMRRIEQETDAAGHSYGAMMDMAGHAVAGIAEQLALQDAESNVLVLVGPGNNGGDGLVAARYLLDAGHTVTVYVWKRDIKGDDNFRLLKRRRRGIAILWADNDPGFAKLHEEARRADLILDALLGTGVSRPFDGSLVELLAVVREEVVARRSAPIEADEAFLFGVPRFPIIEAFGFGSPAPSPGGFLPPDLLPSDETGEGPYGSGGEPDMWDEAAEWDDDEDDLGSFAAMWPAPVMAAVDCPSGLDCDTGALDPAALPADLTITFAFPKWGHLQFPGASACGLLAVADIGALAGLAADIQAELLEPASVGEHLPARPMDAHKGVFGKVMIAAGSLSYTGAAQLSAAAATRAGAGLVTLAIPAPLHAALAGGLPEVTWAVLPGPEGVHTAEGAAALVERLTGYDALLVGPGLTHTPAAQGFIEALFSPQGLDAEAWAGRVVVDADALNILAAMPPDAWPGRLPPGSILTPHAGEMARLTGASIPEVNAARIEGARRWAAAWGHVVLLKGPFSVIAAPDGRIAVSPFALPNLATAGSGDVLAGAIAALLGQGLTAFDAAACGAYVHGYAGALLVQGGGVAGVIARDILTQIPNALQHLYRGS